MAQKQRDSDDAECLLRGRHRTWINPTAPDVQNGPLSPVRTFLSTGEEPIGL